MPQCASLVQSTYISPFDFTAVDVPADAFPEEELPADAAALALTADAVIITAAVKKQIHFFNEVFMCITLRPAP
jgi:hypothetical protein